MEEASIEVINVFNKYDVKDITPKNSIDFIIDTEKIIKLFYFSIKKEEKYFY